MIKTICKIIFKVFPQPFKKHINFIRKQFRNFEILAIDYAQFKTIKNWNCEDRDGNFIPWYTYPAIEYFNNLDFRNKTIFEYGSGNSSYYWSKRSKFVISVECDKKWYKYVENGINSNQKLFFCPEETEYVNLISKMNQKFDVVVIDGKKRMECAKIAYNFLNKESEDGFMVILDNSDWYKNVAKYLRELNLIEVDFHGFGPINGYTWTTSIFLSHNFNFKPLSGSQPICSIGGRNKTWKFSKK